MLKRSGTVKSFLNLFIILTLALQFGCSTNVERMAIQRLPANDGNEIFNAIFSIPQMQPDGKENLAKEAKIKFDAYTNPMNFVGGVKRRFEYIPANSLPTGVQFKVELDVDAKTSEFIYRIFHAPNAFKDKAATYTMFDFVERLINSDQFGRSLQAPFEAYYNAKRGDVLAIEDLLKIRKLEAQYVTSDIIELNKIPSYLASQKALEKLMEQHKKNVTQERARRKQANDKRKIGLEALDKAPEADQFRTKIAKGDRKGAMEILKKYLPWEDMAPFEREFWETYIEVTLNPVPLSERVLIYRGLEGDQIMEGYKAGKLLTEKEAIAEANAFVMSSGMVKNQGSWNRRLRSLEAMNEKFIGQINGDSDYADATRITTMFYNHSQNPQGSPFISFSPKYEVAESFGYTKVSAYLIDPRMLNFNYASTFDGEIEYLVPISTWPDELVGIAVVDVKPGDYNNVAGVDGSRKKILDQNLKDKLKKIYGAKAPEVEKRIKENSYHFFKGDFKEMKDPPGGNQGPANKKFYEAFLKGDAPKMTLSPDGNLSCKDLIELFWQGK